MAPTPESTPHEQAFINANVVKGSKKFVKFERPLSAETASREAHALLQTGLERVLRTRGEYTRSTSPWISTTETPRPFDQMITVQKRRKLGKPQGNAWDQCSDSDTSTSTEEGGKGGSKVPKRLGSHTQRWHAAPSKKTSSDSLLGCFS